MTDESPLGQRTDLAAIGLFATINILVDVLVTHFPHLEKEFEARARSKAEDWRRDPETAPYAETLDIVLRALTVSQRALQRRPPEGQA